jgi:hypothetical protein
MKLDFTRNQSGVALLPTIITAIVLRLGAFGKQTAPTHVRLKAAVERFFDRTLRDHSHTTSYED